MSGWKKLAAASAADGAISPEAVSFDGTNDYLGRSSDLTGNADGKTFTFSAWIYEAVGDSYLYHIDSGAGATRFMIAVDGQGTGAMLRILAVAGASNTTSLYVRDAGHFPVHTWTHVLCSFDMANSSNRYIYINDVAQSVTYDDYLNNNLDFTSASYLTVGGAKYSGGPYGLVDGRLAHVFLDYTYRNLSTTSNRRLFITSDRKPADGQASLSPIIYLPMKDADTTGTNEGTGGNFTVNGTVDTAVRGPNQYNAAASSFDGSNDYLSKTSLSYGSDGKTATSSVQFKISSQTNNIIVVALADGNATRSEVIRLPWDGSNYTVKVYHNLVAGPTVFQFSGSDALYLGRWYQVDWSVDLTDSAKRHVFINGVAANGTWNDYSNTNMDFTNLSEAYVGAAKAAVSKLTGDIGTVWYKPNQYIDLSAENPFYDVATNKPKDLGASGELPYGSSPLIYLPVNAANAGQNFGTGGDFTVNSGPFSGVRGTSEFISRSLYTNGSGYLSRTSLTGASDTKTFTLAIALNYSRNSVNEPFAISSTNAASCVRTYTETGGRLSFQGFNSSDSRILLWESQNGVLPQNGWAVVLFSVDLANSAAHFYVNGVSVTTSADTLTNDSIDLSNINKVTLGADTDGSDIFDDSISLCYFSTDYYDFSQETNRFKFVDQIGYPKNLSQQISNSVISNPLIYTTFADTSDLGANSGTGGDFTVNNTLKPGADVDV